VGDPSEEAPGWDAIDDALAPIYGDEEPQNYGTEPGQPEGEGSFANISVYLREHPAPHFHFVTYGLTELWDKEFDDREISGHGFELTFRLARELDEEEPPSWALHFLQDLGRYVFRTGNAFAAGHKMGLNKPIAVGEQTAITAVCFATDPELGVFSSINGSAVFLQVVGITDGEYRLIQDWCTDGLLELLTAQSPLLTTDLWRSSILDRPGVAEALQARIDRDGSSETSSFVGDLSFESTGRRVVVTLGALHAPAIRRAMLGRIRHRRGYQLLGRTHAIAFEPGEASWRIVEGRLLLSVPPSAAKQIAAQISGRAGRYELSISGVTLVVAPSYLRDPSGRVIDVKGVDGAQAEALIAVENAKLKPAAATRAGATVRRADIAEVPDRVEAAKTRPAKPIDHPTEVTTRRKGGAASAASSKNPRAPSANLGSGSRKSTSKAASATASSKAGKSKRR
jgi:suppressor of fused